MKWSILIVTIACRDGFKNRLLERLIPQTEKYPDIDVICKVFGTTTTLGQNRQSLSEMATGEYVSFIDDDDLVAEDYVTSIYPLLDGVDFVGFPVACYLDGEYFRTAIHSIRSTGWTDNGAFRRDINEKNPIRRELARQAKWEGGMACDAHWAGQMRDLAIVKTEHFIDKPMYHYYIRSHKNDY